MINENEIKQMMTIINLRIKDLANDINTITTALIQENFKLNTELNNYKQEKEVTKKNK
jgi:hypothetical protein